MNFIWCYAPLILEIMTEQEIKGELCYYDLRNPDGVNAYGLLDAEEIKEEGYGNHKKDDCSCDNCFYGRTKMAEELLKVIKERDNLQYEVDIKDY